MSSAKKPVTKVSRRLAHIKPSKVKLDRRAVHVVQGAIPQPRSVPHIRAIGLLLQIEATRVHETADRLNDLPAAVQLTSGDLL